MKILDGLGVTVYIDDVYFADDDENEHLMRLEEVMTRLSRAGLKLNLKKCQLAKEEVNYLGFSVSSDLGLSNNYREKIAQITPPATRRELQSILGLCNYVRDHVRGYQELAKPLYNKLRKSQELSDQNEQGPLVKKEARWVWTAADQANLENLQQAISQAEVLEPRQLDCGLRVQIQCEDENAVVTVENDGGGLSSVELCADLSGEKVRARGKGTGSPGKVLGSPERTGTGTKY